MNDYEDYYEDESEAEYEAYDNRWEWLKSQELTRMIHDLKPLHAEYVAYEFADVYALAAHERGERGIYIAQSGESLMLVTRHHSFIVKPRLSQQGKLYHSFQRFGGNYAISQYPGKWQCALGALLELGVDAEAMRKAVSDWLALYADDEFSYLSLPKHEGDVK